MDRPSWAPQDIDPDRPSGARVYDYFLVAPTTSPSTGNWPETTRLLDLDRPVAVLLSGVLHVIPDDPARIVARLRDAVSPGSFVALVNVTHEDQPPEVIEGQKLSACTGTPISLRSREELMAQLDGWSPVEPGLVHIPGRRPDSPLDVDDHPERFGALAGVGRNE